MVVGDKTQFVDDGTKMSRITLAILIICAMASSTGSSDACPPPCTCTATTSGLEINCDKKDLTQVPVAIKSITENIKKIGLASNKITSLAADAFGTVTCKDINLSNNKDIIINSHAFRGVIGLENIILSDCNLKSLPSDFLLDVPTLKRIYLQDNSGFTSAALAAFGGTSSQKPPALEEINLAGCGVTKVGVHDPCVLTGTRITLTDNQIHCDCNLYKLIKSNTTSLVGVCATPSEFLGLSLATPVPGEKIGYFSRNGTYACQLCADIRIDCKEGKAWHNGQSYKSSEYKNIPCSKSPAKLRPAEYVLLVLVGLAIHL